jgi:hypothetical protein
MSEDIGHLDTARISPGVPDEETVDPATVVARCPTLSRQAARR